MRHGYAHRCDGRQDCFGFGRYNEETVCLFENNCPILSAIRGVNGSEQKEKNGNKLRALSKKAKAILDFFLTTRINIMGILLKILTCVLCDCFWMSLFQGEGCTLKKVCPCIIRIDDHKKYWGCSTPIKDLEFWRIEFVNYIDPPKKWKENYAKT